MNGSLIKTVIYRTFDYLPRKTKIPKCVILLGCCHCSWPPEINMTNQSSKTKRTCPKCAEPIQQAAKQCRFCHQDVTVNIVVLRPLVNKSAHEVVKRLLAILGSGFQYQELKSKLATPDEVMMSGISFAEATSIVETCAVPDGTWAIENQPISIFSEPGGPDSTLPFIHPSELTAKSTGKKRLISLMTTIVTVISLGVLYYRDLKTTQQMSPAPSLEQTGTPIKQISLQPSTDSKEKVPSTVDSSSEHAFVSKLFSATVTIQENSTIGSGFFVHESGYIITNAHVVEPMRQPHVFLETGQRFVADIVRVQKGLDLALLKVSGGPFQYLPLGDATQMQRGETVWTIGAPHALQFTLTKGIISYVGRKVNGVAYLQSDAAINSGNSGGPLINRYGQVIGINTFIVQNADGLGFAIPSNYLFTDDTTILSGIINTKPANTVMNRWLRSTDGSMHARSSSPKSNSATDNNYSQSRLQDLLADAKRLDQEFSRKKTRVQQEVSKLQAEEKKLSEKYYGDRFNLSISEETRIGKKLKSVKKDILETQLRWAEATLRHLNSKKKKLAESLSYSINTSVEQNIRQGISSIDHSISEIASDIAETKSSLSELATKKF